jgi:hypothetical protein
MMASFGLILAMNIYTFSSGHVIIYFIQFNQYELMIAIPVYRDVTVLQNLCYLFLNFQY